MLSPKPTSHTLAALAVTLSQDTVDGMQDKALEALRATIPAARSLPLLGAIARGETERVMLEYLDTARIAVEVTPLVSK